MSDVVGYADIAVGQEIPGPSLDVTREMIAEFATASLDYNALHLDDRFMSDTAWGHTRFKTVIGHGLMTFSLMTRTLTDWLWPDKGDHRRLECRFRTPVYPGDTITARAKVMAKHETRKGKFVLCEVTVTNQRQEIVASGESLASMLR